VLNAIEAPPPLQWATFRIPGVLQRIAIVFLAVAWLTEHGSLRAQIAAVIAALAGYWAALTLIPVPGAGSGVLTPEGNLASFVDRALLGRHLLMRYSDPEGILSTLPAIATAMAGVFAGDWLKERRQAHHSAWLFAAGLLAMIGGLAWGRVFPINKNLWTSSFALFSAGLAARRCAVSLARRCAWMARLVPSAGRLRTQSAGGLFPVRRLRQPADARHRRRQRIGERHHLQPRVRAVAAALLRRGSGIARVRNRLRGAVGCDPRRDVPAAHFHPHLKVSSPAMAHVTLDAPSPRPTGAWYRDVTPTQWKAFVGCYLGWMLDGFDFTILTFLLVDIQRSFTVDKALVGSLGTITLIFRVAGGIGAGTAADRWGRKGPADVLDPLVLRVLVPRRLLDVVPHAVRDPRALRHRHGRRVGGRHAADARALAGAPARHGVGLMQSGYSMGFLLSSLVFEFLYPYVNRGTDLGWRWMMWIGILPAFSCSSS
jgi:hypothetical protein